MGSANAPVFEALAMPGSWPFRTAVLTGPPRSGKSLIARWFAEQGGGDAIDDADQLDETELFHRWNRAQESATPLLLVNAGARLGPSPCPISNRGSARRCILKSACLMTKSPPR